MVVQKDRKNSSLFVQTCPDVFPGPHLTSGLSARSQVCSGPDLPFRALTAAREKRTFLRRDLGAPGAKRSKSHMGQKPKPVPPVNIRFNPTNKIGSKMGGEFTYQPKWYWFSPTAISFPLVSKGILSLEISSYLFPGLKGNPSTGSMFRFLFSFRGLRQMEVCDLGLMKPFCWGPCFGSEVL